MCIFAVNLFVCADAATSNVTFSSKYLGCYMDGCTRTFDGLYSWTADSVTLCTSFCYKRGIDLKYIVALPIFLYVIIDSRKSLFYSARNSLTIILYTLLRNKFEQDVMTW